MKHRLSIFTGTSVLFGGLFIRIDNEQSLRLLGHKVVDCYKAMAILTLNALALYAGLELAARSIFEIMSLISSPAQQLVEAREPREKVSSEPVGAGGSRAGHSATHISSAARSRNASPGLGERVCRDGDAAMGVDSLAQGCRAGRRPELLCVWTT
jgi:hypothetical protein